MTSGQQYNPYISGSFIMSGCWGESFLRPYDRFSNRKLDLIDLNARATLPFEIPRKMWLPIVASPKAIFFLGFDRLLAGVDSVHKNVIRVAGSARNGDTFEKKFDPGCGEVTHLALDQYGSALISLHKNGRFRWTDLRDGDGGSFSINSNYPADMLQYGPRRLDDSASSSGLIKHGLVVSTWGPDIAVWAPGSGIYETGFKMYNLEKRLKRRVTPLCISHDALFLACASHDGFDIIEVVTGKVVRGNGVRGLFGICKAAFSPDGKIIIVCTHERTIHQFELSLY